mmetsp:Transcript_20488/g.29326  ORF Transcript_20488/g.29326 Transcript_20488/m.29326 type:complete len:268 (+) Transcript_20488:185-988(+)|eukprot:CAMPEP_0201685422 /NCGR_PEP_ID=MMETSP0578-20130828/158_1 /ASSEMBLY_ACC=CAM_ASM_000663 /TAXON_ID=267565 /ORGANISM="Skeletonema grethea, Strain CCMP 1804" /LENGTH=267 /DNA_ID=CAMNT_0048169299 /DNA_START=149 /DNA_END=952 /DNA_ORIENTATION=+
MSLEENFRRFYSNFGIKQDPSKMRRLFDDLYHDDFKNELDGKHSLDKDQLWKIQAIIIKSGTTATVLMFKYVQPNVVEYKIHFKGTDEPVGKTVHCAYELMDGKIFHGRAVDESSITTISNATTASINFQQVQKNSQALFTLFDGVPKPFDDEMNQAFEALYHQDFIHNMDGKPLNKAQWKERLQAFAESGARILQLKFEPKNDVHFEAGIRVINKDIDVVGYSRGTISGSKLLKIEPHEDSLAAYAMFPGQKVVHSGEHTEIASAQ